MKVYTATYMRNGNEDRALETKVFNERGLARHYLDQHLKENLEYYHISIDDYDKDNNRYGDEENHVYIISDGTEQSYIIYAYGGQHITEAKIEEHQL